MIEKVKEFKEKNGKNFQFDKILNEIVVTMNYYYFFSYLYIYISINFN